MDIALVRVDNRLIHGQILEAWVPYINASCIIVVDDEVAADSFRESIIRMAVPREVEVVICSVEQFARTYSYGKGAGKKTIVLFSSIADAAKAYELGFRFENLNLGNVYNLHCEGDGVTCSSCVFLNEQDVRHLSHLIQARGVRIELRRVPLETPMDVRNILSGRQMQEACQGRTG